MWLDSDADGCVYDTIDCYHSCIDCKYGLIVCSGCGHMLQWDEDYCLECGAKKEVEY